MDSSGDTLRLEYITIGKILNSFGKQGQVKIRVLTSFPERFFSSQDICLQKNPCDEPVKVRLSGSFMHKGCVISYISGCNNMDDAKKLMNAELKIRHDQLKKLDDNSFYHFQIVGLEVYNDSGGRIGRIKEIIELPANDAYVVKKNDGQEILIPAIGRYIKKVDLENKKMIIVEPEYEE